MSVSITSRPIVSGCNFNAAGNPIVYKLQRSDSAYNGINSSGGFVQVQINGVDLTSFFEPGDSVFVKSTSAVYAHRGTITSVGFSGGNTLITTSITYISSSTSGLIINNSKRTDYRIFFEIFRSSDNSSLTNGVQFSTSPDLTGLMYADVSIVKSLLSAEWIKPSIINEVDSEASIKVYIKYQEYYDGEVQGSLTSDSANPIHAVFAALQIGSENGGNMLAYYLSGSTRLFLTKFALNDSLQGLVVWRDWPFTLSFIHPDGIGTIARVVRQYAGDGTQLSLSADNLAANDDSVNRMLLPSLHADAKRLTVDLGPSVAGMLDIEIRDVCNYNADNELLPGRNPIHLFWKNSLGGDSFWNFGKWHEYDYTYQNGRKAKRIRLFEHGVKPVQWEALNELNTIGEIYQRNIIELTSSVNKTSSRVGQQVYIISKDGTKKTGVIVIPSSDAVRARAIKYLFSVEIELPEIFGME